jgi:hypothetical protein
VATHARLALGHSRLLRLAAVPARLALRVDGKSLFAGNWWTFPVSPLHNFRSGAARVEVPKARNGNITVLRRCYLGALTTCNQKMGKPGNHNVWGYLAAVICVVAVAACGSSRAPNSATRSRGRPQPLKFADCMRANGVPNFPDPSGGGGGMNLAGTGINPQSPAFKAARRACTRFAPGGALGGVRATESQFLAALRFAKCMRVHGFPSFPDPTRVDSPPGPILIIGNGLFFRVSPNFDPNTPAVNRAVAAGGQR